jgi:hypothetical protein
MLTVHIQMRRLVSQLRGALVKQAREVVALLYGLGDGVPRYETAAKVTKLLEKGNYMFEDTKEVRISNPKIYVMFYTAFK